MASAAPAEVTAEECRAEFAAEFEKFDRRPKLVVDYDQRVLWSCDKAPRLLDGPMPLCIRKDKLVVDDEELRQDSPNSCTTSGPTCSAS
ncbi:MAG: hypothetical protein ACXWIO_11130 [Croceibacterium sp.]